MSNTSLAANNSLRLLKDRLTRYSITLGGLMVLMTLLMIFGYLLYVVEPIFRSATVELEQQQPLKNATSVVAVGSDELNEIGYFIDDQAQINFYPLVPTSPKATTEPLSPSAPVTSSVKSGSTLAFGLANGQVLVAQPDFSLDFTTDIRKISAGVAFPLSERELTIDPQGEALTKVAFQMDEEQTSIVAQTQSGRLLLSRLVAEENMMTEEIEWVTEQIEFSNVPNNIARILLSPDQRLMFALSGNQLYVYDLLSDSFDAPKQLLEVNEAGAQVTTISLLSGGSSVLVGNSNGVISQWFEVNTERGRRISKIREFYVK